MEIKDIKQCLNQIKESQEILKAIYTFFIKHNPQKADGSFDMLLHPRTKPHYTNTAKLLHRR